MKQQDWYCPFCCQRLDQNGDCWLVCEYQSRQDGAMPPLTRRQMLERKAKEYQRSVDFATGKLNAIQAALARMDEADETAY